MELDAIVLIVMTKIDKKVSDILIESDDFPGDELVDLKSCEQISTVSNLDSR